MEKSHRLAARLAPMSADERDQPPPCRTCDGVQRRPPARTGLAIIWFAHTVRRTRASLPKWRTAQPAVARSAPVSFASHRRLRVRNGGQSRGDFPRTPGERGRAGHGLLTGSCGSIHSFPRRGIPDTLRILRTPDCCHHRLAPIQSPVGRPPDHLQKCMCQTGWTLHVQTVVARYTLTESRIPRCVVWWLSS
jgi:hypothetical protein